MLTEHNYLIVYHHGMVKTVISGIDPSEITEMIDVYMCHSRHCKVQLGTLRRSHDKTTIDSLDSGFVGPLSSESVR